MACRFGIKWNERAIREVEWRFEEAMAEVARTHKGGTDGAIRAALEAFGLAEITPELVDTICAGDHPPARFSA